MKNFRIKGQNQYHFSPHSQHSRAEAISKSITIFSNDLAVKSLCLSFSNQASMASTSGSGSRQKKGSEMIVKGVKMKAPNFKIAPGIVESLDSHGAQSQIPSKVLLINDIRTHFKCTIQELGTLEMDNALAEMCVDGALKPEYKHLETKGLTHIPHLPRNFQVKWIRYILS